MSVETELVPVENPSGLNVILGQKHFIKNAEDIHEALIGSVPGIKFGVASCEASGPGPVRGEGHADSLDALAPKHGVAVGAGLLLRAHHADRPRAGGVPGPRRYREELPGFRMPAAESKIRPPGRLGDRLHRPGGRVLRSRSREGDGGPEVRGRGTAADSRVQSPAHSRGPSAIRVEEGHDPGALLASVPSRGRRSGPVLRPQRRDRGVRGPRRKDRLPIHLRPLRGVARDGGAADLGVQAGDRHGEGRHRRGIPAEGRVVYLLVDRRGPRDRASRRPHVRAVLHAPRDGDRGGPHRLLGSPSDAPGALAHAPERRIRRAPAVTRKRLEVPQSDPVTIGSRGTREWSLGEEKSAPPWDEGLNNSCFVRILFFCRGRTDKVREVEITTQCPECRGDHLVRDYSRAEIVCEDCGLVLDDMIIDEGPEWRAFDSEQRESRERAGPPSTIMAHDKGLSTSIGWRNKDAYGRQIPHKSRAQIYRLRKWQHRIRTSKSGERSLA